MKNVIGAVAAVSILGGCAMKDWGDKNNVSSIKLPQHVEIVEGEEINGKARLCFSIDEVQEGTSNFVRTLCENGSVPMSDEGEYEGEVCGVLEFPKHPKYQSLFPNSEDARECASDEYPHDYH